MRNLVRKGALLCALAIATATTFAPLPARAIESPSEIVVIIIEHGDHIDVIIFDA